MHFGSIMWRAVMAGLGFGLLLVPTSRAQDSDSVRVVRLALADGQVLVSHAGSDAWEGAVANLPLQEGDTLATQDGRAEIEFENGAMGFLAEDSILQFTRLDFSGGGRVTDLSLTRGAGTFYANLTRQDSFRVNTLTFDVSIPERAEFRVDGFQDGAAVQVVLGDVSVTTTKGSTGLEKGQSVAIHQKDLQLQDLSVGRVPDPDAFDQWVTEEGEMIRAGNKNTLSYIESPNYYGLSDLSRYGNWVNISGLGFSWRPFSAGFGWTPYFNGKWILDSRLGWIWVSSEPWGWMPYHFGSWFLSPTLGWLWVPGGPSGLGKWHGGRVNWVSVGNQVGWVAMAPNDRSGVPANVAKGVITRRGLSPGGGSETNEIISGRDSRSIAPLKQPPAQFASHLVQGAPPSWGRSTIRVAPWTLNTNPSIVYDRGTHTYINREGRSSNDTTLPGRQDHRHVVVPGPGIAPGSVPQPTPGSPHVGTGNNQTGFIPDRRTEVHRVTLPPSVTMNPHPNRVILPPPYPAPPTSQGNLPATRSFPVRPPMIAPPNTQPHSGGSLAGAPPSGTVAGSGAGASRAPSQPPPTARPVVPPATTPAPHAPPQANVARPTSQTPSSASPRVR